MTILIEIGLVFIVLALIAYSMHRLGLIVKNIKYDLQTFTYAHELYRRDEQERFNWVCDNVRNIKDSIDANSDHNVSSKHEAKQKKLQSARA